MIVNREPEEPAVVMVGTGLETMGGISTVVKGYIGAGLFDRVSIVYVQSHSDGSALQKLGIAMTGYAKFARLLAQRKVRLVHIHLSSRASFWRKLPLVIVSTLARKPVLLHLHGSEFMSFYRDECGPVRKRIVKFAFDHSAAVIALSPQWAQDIKEITSNPRIEIILNRVPVPDQPVERANSDGCPHLLFLGRLGRRKGIYDLLDALASIKNQGTNFRLTAAGDGELAQVAARAQTLGLAKHIDLPGWIDEETRNTLLHKADIFVLPSHAEGLPMSLLEAMAASLPVVCSSVGGMPIAVTDGIDGIIVSPGDVDSLARALDRLLRNPDLRFQMGRNAFERAKRDFHIRLSVDQVVSLYERYKAR
jgi:glycosyltransferase involved in cell wall biosynthesis